MKIACIGGGPASLYFALLFKQRAPDAEIDVYEQNRADDTFGFGVVFSDDIGMAASFSAGGVAGRVHAHLDAGCDVVLVCHPELVEESLAAVAGRRLNTMALLGLIGQGPLGWTPAIPTSLREGEYAAAVRGGPRGGAGRGWRYGRA
mgnify:CR=1 FL=1